MLSDSDIDKAQERLEYILATYPEVADKYSEGDEEFCARLEDLCTNSSFDIKTFSVESLYSSGAVQGTSWDKITPSSNQQSSSTQPEVSSTSDEVIDLWGTTDEVNNSDVQQEGNVVSNFEGSTEIDLFGEEDIANNVNNVENSVESVETVENDTAEYTDLGGAFDDFDNPVENSVETVESSVENSVESVETVENSVESSELSVENPVESVETVENLGSSVENPVENVENSGSSVENLGSSVENPVESVENYNSLAESSSSSLEDMLGLGVFDDFFAPVTAPFDASKILSHSDEHSSSDMSTSLLVQADYYADDMDDDADDYGTISADFKSEILERFYASNTEHLASITGIILSEEITVPLSLKATHLSPAFINYIRSYLASLDEDLDGLCETLEDLQTLITTDFNMLGVHQVHSLLTRWGSPYEKLSVVEPSNINSSEMGTMADLEEPLEDFFEGSDISDVVSSSDTQSVNISQPSMEGELGYNYDEVTSASSLYAMLTSVKPQPDANDEDDDELDIDELAEFVNDNADFDDEFEQDYDISSIVKEQGGLVSKLDDIPGDDSEEADSENDNISFDDVPAEDEDEIDLPDNIVESEDADFDELDDNFDDEAEEADAQDTDFDEPDEDIVDDTEDSEEPEGDFDEPDEEPINGSSLGFSLSDADLKACPYELGSKEFVEWINAKYKEFVEAKMQEAQPDLTSGITDADFDDVEDDDETSEIEDALDTADFDDPEEESEISEDEPDVSDADFDDIEGIEDDLEDESETPEGDFDDIEDVDDNLEDESETPEDDFDDIEDEDMPDDDTSEDDFDDVLDDDTEDDLENDDSDADFDDILGDDTEDESEDDSSDADFDDLESSEDDDLDAILGISPDADEEDSSSGDEDFDEPDADFDEDTSSDEPDGEFDDIEDDSDTSLDDILGISSDEDSQSSVEYDDFSDVDELIDDAYSAMENNPLSNTDLGVPETSIKRVPVTAEEKNEAAAEAILSLFNRLVSSPKAAKRVFDNIITKEGD